MFSNYDISPDILRLVLYGNEIDKKYDLSKFQNTMVVSEIAFSKISNLLTKFNENLTFHTHLIDFGWAGTNETG